MHDYHEKFSSITELKVSIMNAFMDHVPATTYFNVGYFLGKQSSKYWIVNKEDLELMYTSMKKKDIYVQYIYKKSKLQWLARDSIDQFTQKNL